MEIIKVTNDNKHIEKKKVCAYVRVSADTLENYKSFQQQMDYFKDLIINNPLYEFKGVFGDYAESGTLANRPQFNRMIHLCDNRDIDLILTKSISRFSRNVVDLLEIVRYLRNLGIDVYFEKENLHSLNIETEFILTILSGLAQNESKSISDNVKWGIRKNFEKGIPNSFIIYGYKWNGTNFIIVPEEAKVIRHIYDLYLNGNRVFHICRILKEEGIKTRLGKDFGNTSLNRILTNIKYTGCLDLQKVYVVDHLSHKIKINNGELPKYMIYNHHEPIIDNDTFAKAQEIKRNYQTNPYLSYGKWWLGHIKCACCDSNYSATINKKGILYFRCNGNIYKNCKAKPITQKKMFNLLTAYYHTDQFYELVKNDRIWIDDNYQIKGSQNENN